MWQCSRQHDNREEAKFCAKCGEKRVTRVTCAECGTVLEPEDVFCTSCGRPREGEAKAAASPPAPAPIVVPPSPAVVAAPVETPAPAEHRDEPVKFSFGGAVIEMKDDSKKPAVGEQEASGPPVARSGMSPALSALLGFALIAAVLGLAFYLVTQ